MSEDDARGEGRRTLLRLAEEGKGFSASTIWTCRSNDVALMTVEWRDERGVLSKAMVTSTSGEDE
jgi:hypothetical protein